MNRIKIIYDRNLDKIHSFVVFFLLKHINTFNDSSYNFNTENSLHNYSSVRNFG